MNNFKPFDKILLKGKAEDLVWFCELYSHYDEANEILYAIGNIPYTPQVYDVIPFEGNEDLVGTNNKFEKVSLEPAELVVVSDNFDNIITGTIRRFYQIIEYDQFECYMSDVNSTSCWKYCIPFKDFNPDNLEETLKHVYCVNNGRLVRANKK